MTAQMKFASTELRSATAVADTAEIFSKCRELILHCSPEFKSFPLYITEPAADHVGAVNVAALYNRVPISLQSI